MRLPEQRLWDAMRTNSPRDIKLQRVENGLDAGMPDVIAIHRGSGLVTWVELKAQREYPKRSGTPVLNQQHGLNISQRNWLRDWTFARGRAFTLIGVGGGRGRDLFLVPGADADRVNQLDTFSIRIYAVDWIMVFKRLSS